MFFLPTVLCTEPLRVSPITRTLLLTKNAALPEALVDGQLYDPVEEHDELCIDRFCNVIDRFRRMEVVEVNDNEMPIAVNDPGVMVGALPVANHCTRAFARHCNLQEEMTSAASHLTLISHALQTNIAIVGIIIEAFVSKQSMIVNKLTSSFVRILVLQAIISIAFIMHGMSHSQRSLAHALYRLRGSTGLTPENVFDIAVLTVLFIDFRLLSLTDFVLYLHVDENTRCAITCS